MSASYLYVCQLLSSCSQFLCLFVLYLSKAFSVLLYFASISQKPEMFPLIVYPVLPCPRFVTISIKVHYSCSSSLLVSGPWCSPTPLTAFQLCATRIEDCGMQPDWPHWLVFPVGCDSWIYLYPWFHPVLQVIIDTSIVSLLVVNQQIISSVN